MSRNIEIKARCRDLSLIRAKVAELNARHEGLEVQTDTYFKVPKGRLKLRESSRHPARLIPYLRPDSQQPRASDYALLPVDDPDVLKELLARMFGLLTRVKKERDVYWYENVRIHLDRVHGLGTFLELEAVVQADKNIPEDTQKVEFLIQLFGLHTEDLIDVSYADLILA